MPTLLPQLLRPPNQEVQGLSALLLLLLLLLLPLLRPLLRLAAGEQSVDLE